MTEKRKPCEIYSRICDVYGEGYVKQKVFTNGLNMGLPLRDWIEKQSIDWKYSDSQVNKSSQSNSQ